MRSENFIVALADGRGRKKKAQERGNTVRDRFCGATKPTRELCSTGEPKRLTLHQGPQECASERGTSVTKKLNKEKKKEKQRGHAPWPSGRVRALCFGGPGFLWFQSWAQTWQHRSSGHAEAMSHIAQPAALTTTIYNYVLGGFGEKNKKKR